MKMIQLVKFLMLAATILPAPLGFSLCKDTIPVTTPTTDFELHGAWVKQLSTGLVWQRCPLGWAWDESQQTCLTDAGTELFNWAAAINAANSNRLGGFSTWRLPNKIEVMTIVERSCVKPALNEVVFPYVGSGAIWTSTPALFTNGYAWRQEFELGEVAAVAMTNEYSVRLVRDP